MSHVYTFFQLFVLSMFFSWQGFSQYEDLTRITDALR